MTEKDAVKKLTVEATVGVQIEKVKCLNFADQFNEENCPL